MKFSPSPFLGKNSILTLYVLPPPLICDGLKERLVNKCCYYFLCERITTQALFPPRKSASRLLWIQLARGQCGSLGLDNVTWLEVISILF